MGDSRLSASARAFIDETGNTVVVSAAVGWEIAIKTQLGKLSLPLPADEFVSSRLTMHGFQHLDITLDHALRTFHLPLHHRDPFDRIMIVQSMAEGIPLITSDTLITQYDVSVIW